MVDVRPLLFINALALMLLVTAGFASVNDKIDVTRTTASASASEPKIDTTANAPREIKHQPVQRLTKTTTHAPAVMPATTQTARKPSLEAEPFSVAPMTGDNLILAFADTTLQATSKAEKASLGRLILRSNVADDTVIINGQEYGATRLELDLEPGLYDVSISKPGFKPWRQKVALEAGDEMTLVGKLDGYTNVNFRNGTWIGGIKTGDGSYEGANGLRYEGHFVNGKFHGKGTAWFADGSRYEGNWIQGIKDGDGVWRSNDNSRYSGEFRADQFNGKGTLTLANGDILTGHWQQGRLNGHGSLTTADGMLYVGGFRDDDFHGRGTLTYPDGRHYDGEFSNGAFHGAGSEVFADGKKYEGEYIEGNFHGQGLLRNPNGSSIEATFRHGAPYGQVRLTTAAGEVFTARTTEPGVCYRDKSYRATSCPDLEGW